MVNTAYSLLNGTVLVPVCLCQICPKWSGCVKQYQKQKEDNSLRFENNHDTIVTVIYERLDFRA